MGCNTHTLTLVRRRGMKRSCTSPNLFVQILMISFNTSSAGSRDVSVLICRSFLRYSRTCAETSFTSLMNLSGSASITFNNYRFGANNEYIVSKFSSLSVIIELNSVSDHLHDLISPYTQSNAMIIIDLYPSYIHQHSTAMGSQL